MQVNSNSKIADSIDYLWAFALLLKFLSALSISIAFSTAE